MIRPSPVALRVSVTEQCSMHCRYCRPEHTPAPSTTPMNAASWLRRIRAVHETVGVAKVRLTGGEPLLYAELPELIRGLKTIGIPDISVTTNGQLLARHAAMLRTCGCERVNISLDSVNEATFARMTGGKLDAVVAGIDAALVVGLRIKLNAVVLRGFNENEVMDLLAFAAARQCAIRFLELMPIGPAASDFEQLYLSGQEIMDRMAVHVSLEPLPYDPAETSRDFTVHWPDGSRSRCGFILPTSTPFCDACRRIRLTADGFLMGCLAQPDCEGMEAALDAFDRGDAAPMHDLISRALAIKQRPQAYREQHAMITIGG